MASAFSGDAAAEPVISEQNVENLHTKIGQLVVERDFWADASRVILGTGDRKRSRGAIPISASGGSVAWCLWCAPVYCHLRGESVGNQALMEIIDKQILETL